MHRFNYNKHTSCCSTTQALRPYVPQQAFWESTMAKHNGKPESRSTAKFPYHRQLKVRKGYSVLGSISNALATECPPNIDGNRQVIQELITKN
mgnify:CR=1 FL=1